MATEIIIIIIIIPLTPVPAATLTLATGSHRPACFAQVVAHCLVLSAKQQNYEL